MKFINFAVVKFSICLVLGIFAAYYLPISFPLIYLIPVLLTAIFFLYIVLKNKITQNYLFGILTFFSFFIIGYANYQSRLPTFQKNHFTHFNKQDSIATMQLKIREELKPDLYGKKYIAEVLQYDKKAVTGKILLIIKKDSIDKFIVPDDVLLIYAVSKPINGPLNPYQFDYRKYMESLSVYEQTSISTLQILNRTKGNKTIKGYAQQCRNFLLSKLENTNLTIRERGIIQALILGEKRGIEKQLYKDYAAAGAVHILAVSGLHVGILLVLLTFFTRPINNFKHGKIISGCIIICCLWFFAFLTGLSPSVTRAVTMFSFLAFATSITRPTNGINTLFLSLLTLLILNPLWLFQIGFQLSYLAVFFILWLNPLLSNLIARPKYRITRFFWSIVTVSIVAQIGVAPLSIYYFHQFPGLFLLTNIVVLPAITIIMFGGLLIVALAAGDILPDWLGSAYNFCIELLNNFVQWVASLDQFLIKNIHFSQLQLLASYLFFISLFMLLQKYRFQRLVFVLSTLVIFLSVYIFEDFKTKNEKLIVFNRTGHTIIAHKNDKLLTIFRNDTSNIKSISTLIEPFLIGEKCKLASTEKLLNAFEYAEKNVLVLDSLGSYPKIRNIDYLLVTQSPKINFERALDSLQPKMVIIDASNYKTFVARWKNICAEKKIPFHYTVEMGAYTFL